MEANVAGGRIEFRRIVRFGSGIPAGVDAEPVQISHAVKDDAESLDGRGELVSLTSELVTIAAVDLVVHQRGNIQRLGWVNVIQESTRIYHYGMGVLTVSDSVGSLPTWDGEPNQYAPFYQGNYWGEAPAVRDPQGPIEPLEDGVRILFSDAPCLPPSRNDPEIVDAEGQRVGLFVRPSRQHESLRATSITGTDRYLLCLVAEGLAGAPVDVAWSLAWDIKFLATITREVDAGLPAVHVDPTSLTRLCVPLGNVDPAALVNAVRTKTDSASLKAYPVA